MITHYQLHLVCMSSKQNINCICCNREGIIAISLHKAIYPSYILFPFICLVLIEICTAILFVIFEWDICTEKGKSLINLFVVNLSLSKYKHNYNMSHPFPLLQHKEENILYIGVGFLSQINVKNVNFFHEPFIHYNTSLFHETSLDHSTLSFSLHFLLFLLIEIQM